MGKIQLDVLAVDGTAELLKIPCSSTDKLAQQGKIPTTVVSMNLRLFRPKLVRLIAGDSTHDI